MLWPSLAIALTCIALTLLANAMRDVLERTVAVRRKRRRAVTTRTGSVAAVTTATSVADLDDSLDIVTPEGGTIRHEDDEQTAARPAEVVLSVNDLRVGYHQNDGSTIEVVHGVSMHVRKGEVHGLIGESGSGKTQTAFAVLGLLPEGGSVTGGSIDYEGTRLDERVARRSTAPSAVSASATSRRSRCRTSTRPSRSATSWSSRCGSTSGCARRRPETRRSRCSSGSASPTRSAPSTPTRTRSPAAWRSAC